MEMGKLNSKNLILLWKSSSNSIIFNINIYVLIITFNGYLCFKNIIKNFMVKYLLLLFLKN